MDESNYFLIWIVVKKPFVSFIHMFTQTESFKSIDEREPKEISFFSSNFKLKLGHTLSRNCTEENYDENLLI